MYTLKMQRQHGAPGLEARCATPTEACDRNQQHINEAIPSLILALSGILERKGGLGIRSFTMATKFGLGSCKGGRWSLKSL